MAIQIICPKAVGIAKKVEISIIIANFASSSFFQVV